MENLARIYIFIFGLIHFLNLSVGIQENRIEVNVHISSQSSHRVRRSENVFPAELVAHFNAFDTDIELQLKRTDHTHPNVPIYIQRDGQVREEKVPRRHFTAFYQDVGYLASVSASCHGGFHGDKDCKHVLSGHLIINGEIHRIEPFPDSQLNGTSNDDHMLHSIAFVQHHIDYQTDYIPPENQNKLQKDIQVGTESSSRKEKAELKIEFLPAVDFAVYKRWYKRSVEKTDAARRKGTLESIREFYAYVINAMDVRYRSVVSDAITLSVVYTGIYIADSPLQSQWTEQIQTQGKVEAMAALHLFRRWLKTTSGLPDYDHAMSFTGYDLVYSGSSAYAGLAYIGGICRDHDMSILEERPDAILGVLAAHDLGHNLNAKHDGDGNTCKSTERWVMSSATGAFTDDKAINHFTFSSCSVDSFADFISDLDKKEINCLATLTSGQNKADLLQYTDIPGQLYPLDVQCQQHMGNSSSHFCRGTYTDLSLVCRYALCSRPENSPKCDPIITWEGTQCGNGKLCIGGECKEDPRAALIMTDCEYGDELRNCSDTLCSDKSTKEQQLCCLTCGIHDETGEHQAPKGQQELKTDTKPLPGRVIMSPTNEEHVPTSDNKLVVSSYIDNPADVAAACTDIAGNTVFNLDCATIGTTYPVYCYPAFASVLNDDCCATCLSINDTCKPECSHGDLVLGCSATPCNTKTAQELSDCCRTCNTAVDICSTTQTTTTTTPTTTTTTPTTTTTTPTTTTTTPTTTTTTPTTTANSVVAAAAFQAAVAASSEFPTAAVASAAAVGTVAAGGFIAYAVYRRILKNAVQKITPTV